MNDKFCGFAPRTKSDLLQFCWDFAEVPCNCIGHTPTIVERVGTPQVGSLLPISLGPVSDGCTPVTRIGISNSRLSVRVIMKGASSIF